MLALVSFGLLGSADSTEEVLSQPGDPFRFVVKEHLPASAPAVAHVADPDGAPMVRLGLQFKGPGMPQAQDAFRSEEDHWFATEKKFYRVVRSQPPALIAFSYVDRPELVDDFLKPPRRSGPSGVARFRYQDRSGKIRVFDWALDGQQGKSVALPESDLTVTLSEATEFPTSTGGLGSDPGRRLDSDRRVQDPVGQGRAGHPHGAGQLADGPQRDSPADESGKGPAAAAGVDPLHGHPHARPQDQRPLRPDRGPGRSRRVALLPRLRPGQGQARASSAPPGRWTRASRSSPSAATPTCR